MSKLKIAPFLLIILGAVFLLNNLGILPWDIWNNLWKFWPVLLILIGVEFIIGQAISLKTIIILLLIIFIVPLVFAFNPITKNPLATDQLKVSEDLGNLTKAKLIIDMPATNLEIRSGDQAEKLVEGSISYSKASSTPQVNKEETFGQAILTLAQTSSPGIPFLSSLKNNTTLFLNKQIPLELQIKTGAARGKIDLSEVRIDVLELDCKAGDVNLIFGRSYSSRVKIKSSAANIQIQIPKEIQARIKIDSKVKNLSIDERFKEKNGEYTTSDFDKTFTKLDIFIESLAGSITIK